MTAHPRFDPQTTPDSARTVQAAYDLAWLDRRGFPAWDRRTLPHLPEIEAAVASLARGTLLQSDRGPVPVEDLVPGDRVATADGEMVRLRWIGARTHAASGPRPLFYRVAADAFGAAGPVADVILGADAHILIESDHCRPLVGARRAFAPIAAFADGQRVAAITPAGDVTSYGLACCGQAALLVCGLPVESYHPARATGQTLNRNVLAEMGNLFPHIADGTGFGAPRIAYLTWTEALDVAAAIR